MGLRAATGLGGWALSKANRIDDRTARSRSAAPSNLRGRRSSADVSAIRAHGAYSREKHRTGDRRASSSPSPGTSLSRAPSRSTGNAGYRLSQASAGDLRSRVLLASPRRLSTMHNAEDQNRVLEREVQEELRARSAQRGSAHNARMERLDHMGMSDEESGRFGCPSYRRGRWQSDRTY